jgi:preprotein translocase subunit SecA
MVMTELKALYDFKEKIEEDRMRDLERIVLLHVIDRLWREHLYNMDSLREGVYLRAYGQKDPLIEYRTEGFGMFSEMMDNMRAEIAREIFRVTATPQYFESVFKTLPTQLIHQQPERFQPAAVSAPSEETAEGLPGEVQGQPVSKSPLRREAPKVGRNDTCPCGSGKKYKKCCGA